MKILNKILITICLFVVLSINYKNIVEASAPTEEVTKPVTVTAGYDYSEVLVYDGYTGNYSNVDWKKEGTYYISYKANSGSLSYIKTVYVIPPASKVESVRTKKTEFRFTSNVVDVLGSFQVPTSVSFNDYILYRITDTVDDGLEFYIYKYSGTYIVSKVQIGTKNQFVLFDFLYDSEDKLIYLVGTMIDQGKRDFCYLVYDLDFNFIEENRYPINNGMVINNIVLIDKKLYISGITNSTNDFFYGCKDNDGFVLMIDVETKIIENCYVSKALGYDLMSKVAIIDDSVYFIDSRTNMDGFSEFFINRLDDNFNVELTKNIGSLVGFTVRDIEVENNQIYVFADVFSYSVNKSISSIYTYDRELNLVNKINLNYTDYLGNGVDIEFSDSGVLTVLSNIHSNAGSGFVYEQYYHDKLILSYKDLTGESPLSIEGNDVSRINTLKNGKNSIIKISSISIQQNPIGRIESYDEVKSVTCFIDGKLYNPSNNVSIFPNECKVYGDYIIVNGFVGSEAIFLKALSFYLVDQINVEESRVYNKGYQLEFNGVGYLNGKLISSGYYLNEEDEYVLEVLGLSNEKRTINFEVKNNLSSNEYKKDLKQNKYNLVKNIIEEGANDNYIETSIDIDGETISTRDNLWIVLIPVVIALLTTICVVRVKFSRN